MWQLHEEAHPVLTDDGGAVLDERTGRWTYLTPTGSAAVMLLLACNSVEQAAERYADRYSIAQDRAAADIAEVAKHLTARGLTAQERPRRRLIRRGQR